MLSHKYRSPRRAFSSRPIIRTCSSTWAAIHEGEAVYKKGSKWIVGKDSLLSFWHDKWLDKGSLRRLIEGPLNRGEEAITLKDMTGFSGWVWQGYSFSFPERLLSEIKATPITFSAMHFDRITWSSSPNRNFDMKEAYKLAILEFDKMYKGNFDGSWIWKVPTIPKIKCFLWQCHHHSILVRSTLAAKGMQVIPLCHFCEVSVETIVHVLRDCCVARNL